MKRANMLVTMLLVVLSLVLAACDGKPAAPRADGQTVIVSIAGTDVICSQSGVTALCQNAVGSVNR